MLALIEISTSAGMARIPRSDAKACPRFFLTLGRRPTVVGTAARVGRGLESPLQAEPDTRTAGEEAMNRSFKSPPTAVASPREPSGDRSPRRHPRRRTRLYRRHQRRWLRRTNRFVPQRSARAAPGPGSTTGSGSSAGSGSSTGSGSTRGSGSSPGSAACARVWRFAGGDPYAIPASPPASALVATSRVARLSRPAVVERRARPAEADGHLRHRQHRIRRRPDRLRQRGGRALRDGAAALAAFRCLGAARRQGDGRRDRAGAPRSGERAHGHGRQGQGLHHRVRAARLPAAAHRPPR